MSPPLPLPHALTLLLYGETTGRPLVAGHVLTLAVAASFAAELQLQGVLVARAANVFALRSDRRGSDGALGAAEARLDGFSGTLKRCISRLGWWGASERQTLVLDELVARGVLRRERDAFLGVTWRTRWHPEDAGVERSLREHLEAYAAAPPPGPPTWEDLLLGLVRGAKALELVWDERTVQRLRPGIDERTRQAPIGLLVRELVVEMEASSAS